MKLRDYQQDIFNRIRASIKNGCRNPLIVSPTGSGKTVMFCYMANRSASMGKNVLILVHRAELISQTSKTLAQFGISHGFIKPGITYDPTQKIQLGMVQTVTRRIDKITAPDLIITDEAHHAISPTYKRVIDSFGNAVNIGFTATPMRLDGKGLKDIYGEIIIGQTVLWLMENGFLVPPKYYAPPPKVNLKGIKKRCGDYAKNELSEAMDTRTITGDAVGHYRKLCNGSRGVAFCCNVKHATHVSEQFNESGIPAAVIHGAMGNDERKQVVSDLTTGKIKILTSVDVISEGFDLPAAEVAILLRPTTSLGLHLQQIGRVLRPSDGKTAYVIDHVGNLLRHGIAEDLREWSLDGVEKQKREKSESLGMRQCEQCYCLHEPSPVCPESGYEYPASPPKEIKFIDGDLEEFKRKPLTDILKDVKKRSDLQEIQKAKVYKPGWVWHMSKEMGMRK